MLGVYLEGLGESSELLGRSLNVHQVVFGDPRGGLGGTQTRRGFLGASREGPGGSWGGFGALWLSSSRSWD